MQSTTNYSMNLVEGTDIVNIPVQLNPNFQTIDGAMFDNKQASVGTATEVVTGTSHAIVRNNPDSDVFRFTATGAWTAGDTMSVDGNAVTVHLSDGTVPPTGAYIIGAEVLAVLNSPLVTLMIGMTPPAQGVTSFNSRTGAVVPTAGDYVAADIDYDNTLSGLTATEVQSAIDELAASAGGVSFTELWANPDTTQNFAAQNITLLSSDYDMLQIEYSYYAEALATQRRFSVILSKGFSTILTSNSTSASGVIAIERSISRNSDTSFSVGDGSQSIGTGAATTRNDILIPTVIRGIKF